MWQYLSGRKLTIVWKLQKREFLYIETQKTGMILDLIQIQTMLCQIPENFLIPPVITMEYDTTRGMTGASTCSSMHTDLVKLSKCYHGSVTVDYLTWLANMLHGEASHHLSFRLESLGTHFGVWDATIASSRKSSGQH